MLLLFLQSSNHQWLILVVTIHACFLNVFKSELSLMCGFFELNFVEGLFILVCMFSPVSPMYTAPPDSPSLRQILHGILYPTLFLLQLILLFTVLTGKQNLSVHWLPLKGSGFTKQRSRDFPAVLIILMCQFSLPPTLI